MRKFIYAAVALTALVATSFAVADAVGGAKTAQAVTGTFSAAGAATHTRSCTTADSKIIVVTDGRYTGAATGSADLTGTITLHAHSLINTTDGVGVVGGHFKIDVASGPSTVGKYTAVYDHGTIAGLAVGKAHQPHARLIANLSATTFSPATGFTGGKLGGGTAAGIAVEVGPGSCKPAHPASTKSEARGVLAGLPGPSVAVSGLTCTIPSAMSVDVNARFHNGDNVQIRCETTGATTTLTRIDKRH